ncbi:MAG: TldD/PmbA family protein [Pseudomonadota bacterium]
MTDVSLLAETAIHQAQKAGADAADVLVVDGTSLSIEVRNGALEAADRSESTDIGLRVLVDGRQASLSISDGSEAAITAMAERAVAMAKEAPQDPSLGLADADQLATDWDIDALDLSDPNDPLSPDALEALAQEADSAALAIDGVSQSLGSGAGLSRTQIFLATSNGFRGGYTRTGTSVSSAAISGEGLSVERDYAFEARVHAADLPSATEIGRLAGERAVARAGAKRPKTGAYPVLFDERVSSSLIGHIIGAMNGSSIVRGSSWLKDHLGQQILPKGLSVTEDPSRPRTSGSRPFDGEGLSVSRRNWIDDGIVSEWILDLGTARKLGRDSTGNASRSVSGPPSPSVGNLSLTQGMQTKEDLLAQMGTGLWVTSMIGSTINPNTGDYSRGISGFWVQNGEVQGPVNEATIAGNLKEFLPTVIPANDARTHLSRVVPSLLVEGLTIAGD